MSFNRFSRSASAERLAGRVFDDERLQVLIERPGRREAASRERF